MKVVSSRADENRRATWFWLDSRNMPTPISLDEFTRTLMIMDTGMVARYEYNRGKVFNPIADIDRKMEYGYRVVAGVPVFSYHDMHQYFEQAYAMKVVGMVVSPPSAPLSAATGLINLKSWLTDAPSGCLFTEKVLDEPHLEHLPNLNRACKVELDSLGTELPPARTLTFN